MYTVMFPQFCEDVKYIIYAYLSCAEYQFLCKGKLNFDKYFKFREKYIDYCEILNEEYECIMATKYLVNNAYITVDIVIDAIDISICKNRLNSMKIIINKYIHTFDNYDYIALLEYAI